MNSVSVIIVTHNNQSDIADTLRAIQAQPPVAEILCIDNASFDNTSEIVRSFPDVQWIQNYRNLGFSAALNQGIRKATEDLILALNPDAILQDNSLQLMVNKLNAGGEKLCGVGPKLIFAEKDYYNNTILDSVGIVLSRKNVSPFDQGHGEIDHHQYDQAPYFGPSAACALFRKSALEKISPDGEIFDEEFFAYFEDVDFVWRARLLGFEFSFVPDAIVVHNRKNPQSHPINIQAMAFANRWFCALKNETHFTFETLIAAFRDVLRWGWLTVKHPKFFWAFPRFIKFIPSMLKKRQIVQKKRTVDNQTVQSFL